MIKVILAAVTAAILSAAPYAASAQSYANNDGGDAQIRGRVLNFDGGYNLQVRDDQGYVDNVALHQGTIINPTGITLAPGMVVSVLGYNAGSTFDANEVDTPYTYYEGVPYYGGHSWNYYGPSVGIGFYFGNTGWWHGNTLAGPYQYNGGTRVYTNVRVNQTYRGGTFQGRAYTAPASRGGYVARSNSYGGSYNGGGQRSAGVQRGGSFNGQRGESAAAHGGGGEQHR
jgi:hypothetical protein